MSQSSASGSGSEGAREVQTTFPKFISASFYHELVFNKTKVGISATKNIFKLWVLFLTDSTQQTERRLQSSRLVGDLSTTLVAFQRLIEEKQCTVIHLGIQRYAFYAHIPSLASP
ncbi:unnamed protein product [Orchesella dallaii]|uniref:Uncharacterized protein n=1 Tax=Orchesella dallaii TaxID=48710 RepID=A0ABP1PX28_9HEXA